MTLGDKKKGENIAEYILYVWQMEDLLRATAFDETVVRNFVQSFTSNEEALEIEYAWFLDLMKRMKSDGVKKKGHVYEVREIIGELALLHQTLLNIIKDSEYQALYKEAQAHIGEYLRKSGDSMNNDVETCLTALYGLLVLRLKKAKISPETEEAMKTFSQLMAQLSVEYKKMKTGEMNVKFN